MFPWKPGGVRLGWLAVVAQRCTVRSDVTVMGQSGVWATAWVMVGVPTLPGWALPSTSSLDADSMSENVSSLQPPVRADKVPSPPTSGPGFLLTDPQGALKEDQWAPFPPAQAP